MVFNIDMADFFLSIETLEKINKPDFQEDISVKIIVKSEDVAFSTIMTVDTYDYLVFIDCIKKMYSTLSGTAVLRETYGRQMKISFIADIKGHIFVEGRLYRETDANNFFAFEFTGIVDQTAIVISESN